MTQPAVRPAEPTTWAEINEPYLYVGPAGEIQIAQRSQRPPVDKLQHGFKGGEALPASWVNFLFRQLARWTRYLGDQVRVSDGTGAQIVDRDDVALEVFAVDSANPANFVRAVGYRAAGAAPVLNTDNSNVLSIGTPTSLGTIPIDGAPAANVRLVVRMYGAT